MSDAQTYKLLPCPFCGNKEPIMCEFNAGHSMNTKAKVFSVGCKDEDCQGYMSYAQFDRRSEAAAAWNKRHVGG